MIELYHNAQSRAVMIHALLEELGVPFALRNVRYDDGSMRSEEFLSLNPMGKIPTLVDGEVVVAETAAVAVYLADRYKTPCDLAPNIEDPRRGEYLKWVVFQSTGIDAAMTQASVKFEIPRSHAGWGSTEVVVGVLRQRLAGADPYLFGSWFTAADLLLGMGLSWGFQFGLFPEHPELTRFAARVRERPAVERALSSSQSESTET